jgi:uncharacterized protein (DUF1778 family)
MPATNPRISVTVTPSVEAVLTRLAVATGQSKSSFIAELLESSMPVFERMATVIEAAQQAKDTLKSQTMKDMEDAESRLHEILGVTLDIFDESTAPILEEAERVNRRGRRSQSGRGGRAATPAAGLATPAQPPYVTRGSGTPKTAKGAGASRQKKSVERSESPSEMPAKGSKRAVVASKRKVKG